MGYEVQNTYSIASLLAAYSNFAISEAASVVLVSAGESSDLGVETSAGKLEFLPSGFPVATFKKEVVGDEEHDSHKSKTHDFSHGLPLRGKGETLACALGKRSGRGS